MMKRYHTLIILVLGAVLLYGVSGWTQSQEETSFKRGRLWEKFEISNLGRGWEGSWNVAAVAATQWPGYEPLWSSALPTQFTEKVPSYSNGGGPVIATKIPTLYPEPEYTDSEVAENGWWWDARDIGVESTDPYFLSKHELKYPELGNAYLKTTAEDAELVVETVHEWSTIYEQSGRRIPARFTRRGYQFGSYGRDQDYILIEYTVENISDELGDPHTLEETWIWIMFNLLANHRGAELVGNPQTDDDIWTWMDDMKMWLVEDGDSPWAAEADRYDHTVKGGVNQEGQWASPGFAGGLMLYVSPNDDGLETHVNADVLTAPHGVWSQPWFGVSSGSYDIIAEPMAYGAFPYDVGVALNANYFLISRLGPFTIAPGEAVEIHTAEMVTGVDAEDWLDYNTPEATIASGKDMLLDLASYVKDHVYPVRQQLGYYNVPDPPAGPESVTVTKYEGTQTGNTLTWSGANESLLDPDYPAPENDDLVGYKVYRSQFSIVGPWEEIATIAKGNASYYDETTGMYTYDDFNVAVGSFYLYSVTAYDGGHADWPPDPTFGPVPSLETSTMVSATREFFQTTAAPDPTLENVRVVPNPFVIESGFLIDVARDALHFVNIPANCTIRIFNINGDLIDVLHKNDDTNSIKWLQLSSEFQFVESGLYVYHITSHDAESDGQTAIGKFAIIR